MSRRDPGRFIAARCSRCHSPLFRRAGNQSCPRCVNEAAEACLPAFYGRPIDTPAGHRWAGYEAQQQ